MGHLSRVVVFALALLSACSAHQATTTAQPTSSNQPQKKPDITPADEGAFRIYQNEQPLGTTTFRWSPNGVYDSTFTLSLGSQTVTLTMLIHFSPDGEWQHVQMTTPRGSREVRKKDGRVVSSFQDKSVTAELKPGMELFGNVAPALLRNLVRKYDRAKRGKQSIPVFLIDAGLPTDASVEWKDEVMRNVAGRDVPYRRFAVELHGVDLLVWADTGDRVDLVEIPAQHSVEVRDGYDALIASAHGDKDVSGPDHEVQIERNVNIPMRDGVALTMDLYRPKSDGQYPVIVLRTPYKKELLEARALFWAKRGYVTAVQDVRGRFSSAGRWQPWVNEPKDGYDTIEWLAVQPWSTGKVGMIGASYGGFVQWAAASQHPAHLVTIVPNVTPPDPFFNVPYEYGVYFALGNIWWTEVVESNATGELSGVTMAKIGERKYTKLLKPLPVIDLDKALFGRESGYWRECIAHPTNDAYWQQASYLDKLSDVDIPVFHQSGWFDGDGIGTKLAYAQMLKAKHLHQKLVLGPWGHTDQAQRMVLDRDFGPQAVAIDLQREYLRWFDHWLKGVDNGIDKEPLVSIFIMGTNQWRKGQTYPLESTRLEKWYLASVGHANTTKGDGRLVRELAPGPADSYAYDPEDPTPTLRYYEQPEREKGSIVSYEDVKKASEANHEQLAAGRQDILVYQTPPFDKPYTFAGPIEGVISASTSGRDTDWFMSLSDVAPDGKLLPLVEGKIRARFRKSLSTPELVTPRKIEQYKLNLWQTGIMIDKGHRLRVEITSASFPMFSRNLNTGDDNETGTHYIKVTQKIYHDKRHPSYVVLPAIQE